MAEVVLNPETGKPAVAELVYRDLERDAEQAQYDQLANELNAVTSQHDELAEQKAALEGKLEDQKSLLDGIDSVTPAEPATDGDESVSVDEGAVGASSEEETDEEADAYVL
jgi:hypothetical protein